jgi:outer membrane protein W
MPTKFIAAIFILILASTSASAQRPPAKANSLAVFMSNGTIWHSGSSGTHFDAGYGLALRHQFKDRLSAELSVTTFRYGPYATSLTDGSQSRLTRSSYAYPVDATVAYHIVNDSRWQPYIGGGLRYVSESSLGITRTGGVGYPYKTRSLDAEVAGGVVYQFRPSLGLRFDAKQVLRNRENVADSSFNGSIGLAWRF